MRTQDGSTSGHQARGTPATHPVGQPAADGPRRRWSVAELVAAAAPQRACLLQAADLRAPS